VWILDRSAARISSFLLFCVYRNGFTPFVVTSSTFGPSLP
jgi:hypothetical protein